MLALVQPIANGVLLGGIYAAVAVGLSLVFGVVKLVNLAHGDLIILASFLCLAATQAFGISPFVAAAVVIPTMFMAGYLLQRLLLNRALPKGLEPSLIICLGVSTVLQNALLLVCSPDARSLPTSMTTMTIPVAEFLTIPVTYVIGFVSAVIMIFLLHVFLRKTFLGRAVRAAADDAEIAQLMGINTGKIFAAAMGISLVTAAVAGIIVGTTFTFYPHSGPQFLIIAFGVVIVGGVGSMIGTLAGGIALGVAQLLGAHVLGPGYQLLTGYLFLLLVLSLRPEGIFGKQA